MGKETSPVSESPPYRIGEVAGLTGLSVEAVRYYEREGLVPAPLRRPAVHHAGYRLYPESAVVRLRAILRAKELGFTLREIRELIALGADPGADCHDVRNQARAKLEDVRARIANLHTVEAALAKLVRRCSKEGPAAQCPILDSLGPGIR